MDDNEYEEAVAARVQKRQKREWTWICKRADEQNEV